MYPHPLLKRPCEPCDRSRSLEVLQDLVDTMRAHPGCVGLAAPQVGEPVRVAVVDVSGHRHATSWHGLVGLVNPRLQSTGGYRVAREGCLSLPEITADVGRAERILLLGANLGSMAAELWSDGFEARAIQHEMDHLDGILILDRVASVHGVYPRRS